MDRLHRNPDPTITEDGHHILRGYDQVSFKVCINPNGGLTYQVIPDEELYNYPPPNSTAEAIRLASEANRSLGEAMGLLRAWLDFAQIGYHDDAPFDKITIKVATREFLARARKEQTDG
jgi:hypothetical protein